MRLNARLLWAAGLLSLMSDWQSKVSAELRSLSGARLDNRQGPDTPKLAIGGEQSTHWQVRGLYVGFLLLLWLCQAGRELVMF